MQKAIRFDNGDIEKELAQEGLEALELEPTLSDKIDFLSKTASTQVESEYAYTDNGATVYASSGSNLVNFDFNTSSMRTASTEDIARDFCKFFYEDKDIAMRYLFYVGDIREGKGERHIFNEVLSFLAANEPEITKAILPLIPEYSRWDYVANLVTTPVRDDAIALIKSQLEEDMKALSEDKPVSLLAKWLPSINASKKETIKKALIISQALGMDKKTYRKTLASLRDKSNVIEKLFAEKNVAKLIDMQESFTSKQNIKYKKALMNLMPEERKLYFEKVLRGEAKFNVDVLEPYEIYFKYSYERDGGQDLAFETMWKMLPNKVLDGKDVLVVRDGSGSMECARIPGTTRGRVIDVASALTVYFSQYAKGGFKDKFITFSSRPEVVDLSGCKSLHDKIELLESYDDCSNTNLEATFDLILKTAIDNKLSQDELPKNLLIVSDMQFDAATCKGYAWNLKVEKGWDEPIFTTIRNKFEEAGYKIPRLIFWNVNTSKTAIPEIKNELGLVLLSGYSKNIMEMICEDNFEVEIVNEEGKKEVVQLSPEEILINKVKSERYDAVSAAIAPVLEADKKFEVSEER